MYQQISCMKSEKSTQIVIPSAINTFGNDTINFRTSIIVTHIRDIFFRLEKYYKSYEDSYDKFFHNFRI